MIDLGKPLFQYDAKLRALAEELDGLQDTEAKTSALNRYFQSTFDELEREVDGSDSEDPSGDEGAATDVTRPSSLGASDSDQGQHFDIFALASRHGLSKIAEDWVIRRILFVTEGPLEGPPCANIELEDSDEPSCPNAGKLTCSNCRLVSYCSKVCQKKHWRGWHKQDCNGYASWQPAWVDQKRRPNFTVDIPAGGVSVDGKPFTPGLRLWGTVPAVDTINVAKNEGTSPAPLTLALAYVVSGGLRNVVRTINSLPSNFSGEVTVLLNDKDPIISIRNLMLFSILARLEDVSRAADVALHFWASAYGEQAFETIHAIMLRGIIKTVKSDGSFELDLGHSLRISGLLSEETSTLLSQMYEFEMPHLRALDEMERVMFAKSRQDRVHRIYCRVKPPHRVALQQYRINGNVLPHGGDYTYTFPNKFLFSLDGKWLQGDLASPLNEWNIEDVVAGGIKHGAQAADIIGCLYFYLLDELRTFASRLRELKISVKLFTEEPRSLAQKLSEGLYERFGLPKSFGFDRVDISDIAETCDVGLPDLLEDWAPFLNKNNPSSTILGYFVNWTSKQRKSQPGPPEMQALLPGLIQKGRLDKDKMLPELIPVWLKYFVALHDNSPAFEEFLEKEGVDEAALKFGLRRKIEHTIVPHRIGARLGDLPNALPHFPTDSSWYWNVQVSQVSLSERYVEFSVAQ